MAGAPRQHEMGREMAAYSEAQLELFAAYRERRAALRPRQCNDGPQCWVRDGPVAWSSRTNGCCLGCKGLIRVRTIDKYSRMYPQP